MRNCTIVDIDWIKFYSNCLGRLRGAIRSIVSSKVSLSRGQKKEG